jgi:hypothetical protein
MKNLLFGIIFLASLSFQIGFALTPQECDNLLKNGSQVDPLKIGSLTTQQILDCASPSAAKTQILSPLSIFQLIINAISLLAFGLAVLALIVSVIQIATSAGDKDKFKEAIGLAKNAGLAIILTMTAYGILYLILNTFGFSL